MTVLLERQLDVSDRTRAHDHAAGEPSQGKGRRVRADAHRWAGEDLFAAAMAGPAFA